MPFGQVGEVTGKEVDTGEEVDIGGEEVDTGEEVDFGGEEVDIGDFVAIVVAASSRELTVIINFILCNNINSE